MTNTVRIAPPNSLVLISDAQGGVVPDPDAIARNAEIISTASCIAVCCLAAIDGETEITLGPAGAVGPADDPAYDGTIVTPTRAIVVWTVEWRKLLEMNVPTLQTRLRVWTNRQREPDKVIIGLG
jgi:hypothetical protein